MVTPHLPFTAPDRSKAPDPLAPAQLGPITLRNRIIKSATFEGMTPGALVSDDLIEFHRKVGEGGTGMTTVAYLAVSPEGRTERDQIYWRPEALPGLQKLTDAVHETGAKVNAQLGHAGPVANSRSNGLPSLSPSARPNPMSLSIDKAATEADIRRIIRQTGEAARMAVQVGFDAVEVHLGHNYLLSSFLSPNINHRKDAWGGSFLRRAAFPRAVLQEVREAVGGEVAITAKLNMSDGVKGGLWLDESIPFAQLVEADGTVDALELTGGSSLLNPMYLFRGDIPLKEMAASQTPILKLGMHVFGDFVFKKYPYEPMYFLNYARQFRRETKLPLVLLGGITDLPSMDIAMEEGFEFVAMARALLREPNLPKKIKEERDLKSACIHCNLCAASIFIGTRCPLATEDGHPEVVPA